MYKHNGLKLPDSSLLRKAREEEKKKKIKIRLAELRRTSPGGKAGKNQNP